MKNLENLFARQDLILHNVPNCPACSNAQVQIINWNKPAQWKCRICKHSFEYEPEGKLNA